MAKKRGRPHSNADYVPPGTDVSDARERNRAGIQIENQALDFAEDLGRLLGTTQKKAEEWLGQRKALAERLTQIRDAAAGYLQQLTGVSTDTLRPARRGPGRRPGSLNKAAAPAGRKRKRTMSAEAREKIRQAQLRRWAKQKRGE
jgi:hypothetical protein